MFAHIVHVLCCSSTHACHSLCLPPSLWRRFDCSHAVVVVIVFVVAVDKTCGLRRQFQSSIIITVWCVPALGLRIAILSDPIETHILRLRAVRMIMLLRIYTFSVLGILLVDNRSNHKAQTAMYTRYALWKRTEDSAPCTMSVFKTLWTRAQTHKTQHTGT